MHLALPYLLLSTTPPAASSLWHRVVTGCLEKAFLRDCGRSLPPSSGPYPSHQKFPGRWPHEEEEAAAVGRRLVGQRRGEGEREETQGGRPGGRLRAILLWLGSLRWRWLLAGCVRVLAG